MLLYKGLNDRDTLVRSLDVTDKELTRTKYYFTADGKDSLTLRTSTTLGVTLDSVIFKYDSQRRLIAYKYMLFNTVTKVFWVQLERKWLYENDKLTSYFKSLYTSGSTPYYTDSTITSVYTGNVLNATEEKYSQRHAVTQAIMDSTTERSRFLTYNTAGKPTVIEMDEWDYTNKRWKRMANVAREYTADTLIKKETRIEIGVRTGIYTYDEYKIFTYETCQSLTSSATDIVQDLPFSIAPNPASSNIRINLEEDNLESSQLTIYSLQGSLMQTKRLTERVSSVDVSSLPRGMYLVKVQQGNRFAVKKLTLF